MISMHLFPLHHYFAKTARVSKFWTFQHNRRNFIVAARSGQVPLTEPTAGTPALAARTDPHAPPLPLPGVATENRIRDGAGAAMGYPRFGMLDLLKLLSGLLVGLFRSHAAREAETAFLRQQLVAEAALCCDWGDTGEFKGNC